ncbi:hypothetical protein C10C_0334 [Chlamydia serpentis]|uniref:Uncharacterized protein n=1 Tax=Chlamydia serpentis TaxID=1967782 RepID=A0A2R8FB38_9CHLA|nr:hypothetical protein [Chlamydia serpentis]SPN73506.1 hypothetical protein C10C_0334 [Chlamydia serpentis]
MTKINANPPWTKFLLSKKPEDPPLEQQKKTLPLYLRIKYTMLRLLTILVGLTAFITGLSAGAAVSFSILTISMPPLGAIITPLVGIIILVLTFILATIVTAAPTMLVMPKLEEYWNKINSAEERNRAQN